MIIEIDGLHIAKGGRVILNNVYMKFNSGEITGVFGRNGSGKTTLFNVLMGVDTPEIVSLRLNGTYCPKLYRKGVINYISAKLSLPESLTGRKAASIFKVSEEVIAADLRFAGIDSRSKLAKLSLGQQRFVEAVLFLRSDKQFTIMDEPFGNLTPIFIEYLLQIMEERRAEKGLIICDHQYRYISKLVDSAYLIKDYSSYPLEGDLNEGLVKHGYLIA
jgi:ABC-2 type transport system ATP-binding protein